MRTYEEAERESKRQSLKRSIEKLGSQISFFERELHKIEAADKKANPKASKKKVTKKDVQNKSSEVPSALTQK